MGSFLTFRMLSILVKYSGNSVGMTKKYNRKGN